MQYKHVKQYEHVYARVKAVALTAETQSEIVDILVEDVSADKMAKMVVKANKDGVYVVTFRYKTDTVDQVLDPDKGSYLVIRENGVKVSMTPEKFKETYFIPEDTGDDIDPDFTRPTPEEMGEYPIAGVAMAGVAKLGKM